MSDEKPEIKLDVKKIREQFLQAAVGKLNALDPEKFVEGILVEVEKDRREILMKMLGMDDHWGRWEIDHCNGRTEKSMLGQYIYQNTAPLFQEWMEKTIRPLIEEEKLKLTASMKDAIRKEVKEIMTRQVQHGLYEIAAREANEIVAEIAKEEAEKIRDQLRGDGT